MMKILLAAPIGLSGGIARWTEHILNYSNDQDICKVDFLSMTLNRSGNPVKQGLYGRIKNGLIDYSIIAQQEKKLIREKKYDVIHITSSASISLTKDLYMTKIAHKHGVKVVIHFHFGRIPELAEKCNWEWRLLCKVIKSADTIIVLDSASYKTLLQAGFTNIRMLPNPIASEVIKIAQETNVNQREEHYVLFVGHGYRSKGIYELVDSCRNIPNVKVKMLGAILDSEKEALYRMHYRELL